MRRLSALIALLGATELPQAPARAAPFDGIWSVTQECEPAPGGARGFKWLYDATVKDGRLLGRQQGQAVVPHARRASRGRRNRGPDASGLNGKSEYTVGFGQPGEKFSYPVSARFEATRGTGIRTQGRTCRFSFVKI
jgi:hypothetical protein